MELLVIFVIVALVLAAPMLYQRVRAAQDPELAVTWAAEQARLKEETLGRAGNFRFFSDGTVQLEGTDWRGKKPPAVKKSRARVVDAHYFDGRMRKSVGGRSLAAITTGGLSLAASNNAGQITLSVVTDKWVETQSAQENSSAEKVYALALQAKGLSTPQRPDVGAVGDLG